MSTIWKFPVPLYKQGMFGVEPVIDMPVGAKILTLQLQDGHPTLWAAVDPARATEPRRFAIVGTGHPMPDGRWRLRRHLAVVDLRVPPVRGGHVTASVDPRILNKTREAK